MRKHDWRAIVVDRLIQTQRFLQTKTHPFTHKAYELLKQLNSTIQPYSKVYLGRPVRRVEESFDRLRHERHLVTIKNELFTVHYRQIAPYIGLLIITSFVFLANQANQQALAASTQAEPALSDITPEQVSQVLSALDPLTPGINEQADDLASSLAAPDAAVLPRPEVSAMVTAADLSKKDPIPYQVKQGDTLVSIAKDHSRSVATILDANGIAASDAGKIKPGTTLLIPQEDSSHSTAWLEADQKARAQAAQKLADQQAAKRAKSKTNATLASFKKTVKEQSNEGFDGSSSVSNFITPISYTRIARRLGGGHMGIDFDAPIGTSVAAAVDGRVIEITHGWGGGFGTSILVDDGNGITTRYGHLSDVKVGIGDVVGQGQAIALSGNTGNSTGPHLHFETRLNGRAIDPFL